MNGQNGGYFTYVVGNFGDNYVNDGGFSFNEQAFIPASASEINFVERNGVSPAEQYAALEKFIDADSHLSDKRGGYADRNGAALPFRTIFDARFLQRFKVQSGSNSNTLEFSVDIFNLNNLLNKEWGRINSRGFGTYELYRISNISDEGVPSYTLNSEILDGVAPEEVFEDTVDDFGLRSSRWTMQLGVRYTFK